MEISVRPIRNEDDYEVVLAEVDELMDAAPGTPEGDRLDVLVTLVEAYEARHWDIDLPDPIEAIQVRMEQMNLRQTDLVPLIGSRGRVSEVLSRKRALTLPMIRRLAEVLELGADVLIQEASGSRQRLYDGRKRRSPKKKPG
jgi:HTH-type transcriptional regulator / antitoxin HigA